MKSNIQFQTRMNALLNRPMTRESKKKLREDIDEIRLAMQSFVNHVKSELELRDQALIELNERLQTLEKKPMCKKSQKCSICRTEGHNKITCGKQKNHVASGSGF
jgi:hypothetical protein